VRGAGYRELNYAAQFMTKILGVDDDAEGTASRKEVLESEGHQE
jgi:CheY-like chemotaxis protein